MTTPIAPIMTIPVKFSATHAFKIIYFIVLILLVNLGYVLSFTIQPYIQPLLPLFLQRMLAETGIESKNINAYMALVPFISISTFLLSDFLQIPRFFRKKNLDVVSQSIKFALIQTMLTTTAAYFGMLRSFPRSVLLLSGPLIFIVTAVWTGIGLQISRKLYSTGKLVIIGSNEEEIADIESKITSSLRDFDLKLADHVIYDDQHAVRSIIQNYSEVLICPSVPDNKKSDIILYCARMNTVAYLVPQFYEIALYESRMINFNDLMVFMLDRLGLSFEQRIAKRIFDIIVSLLALILSSPFMLVSIVLVKISSPGPVIYRQERVTLDNTPYFIYKLRTMRIDAEHHTGPVISGKDDPRVTGIGKFLRRSKLDEVPQFVNVLLGEMSVVGPRSERPVFVEQFQKIIPAYSQRFAVKAGITGLAQVAGSYDTSPEDKLRYDLLYIKNYSILQDIKITFQTVQAVFTPNLYNKTFMENQDTFCPAGGDSSENVKSSTEQPLPTQELKENDSTLPLN